MDALPREGLRDLSRRLNLAWHWVARWRIRRDLFHAEAELGKLGIEQVDLFDEELSAQAQKVREFEDVEAALVNSSAELSARKAVFEEEYSREKAVHDKARATLADERQSTVAKIAQAEDVQRLRLEAARRFQNALEELDRREKQLEALSTDYMKIARPSLKTRTEAREVSDELRRIADERTVIMADRVTAVREAERQETVIAQLRAQLRQIETSDSDARERLDGASRKLAAGMRELEQAQKKSNAQMSRLDREKRHPYRSIGACMADQGIAPLNQPEALEKVYALREREAALTQILTGLQAACATMDTGLLIAFYLVLAALLFAVSVLAYHLVHGAPGK